MSKLLQLRLSAELDANLRLLAQRLGMPASEFIRAALREKISKTLREMAAETELTAKLQDNTAKPDVTPKA